jgi:hypothetical protein
MLIAPAARDPPQQAEIVDEAYDCRYHSIADNRRHTMQNWQPFKIQGV